MTATLSTSQTELPRLVEIASLGEDVVITVEGKPKARLTRVAQSTGDGAARQSPVDLNARILELASLRTKFHTGMPGLSVDQILDTTRADQP
jgi:antitoxin (DNA-binding transcriptional repressor) of toxin-antitoxin stability system